MKKLFLILSAFSGQFRGQVNLVPNASFETYTACPMGGGTLSDALGWVNPTSAGNSDYYNACSSLDGVPYCCGSVCNCFQYAKSGVAYAGLYTFVANMANLREYIQIQLISPMINGKCYFVGFYANQVNWCGFACNNVAAYLSSTAISLSGPTYLMNYPAQIKAFNNPIIKDTLNWTFVGGIFQASNSEHYITIGNFNTDATTDTIMFNPSAVAPRYSYHIIDSVFVIPIDSMPGGMPAFAGNNTTINPGDSTFIGQQISNLNCNWYNGTVQIATNTSGLYVKPAVTTTYVVQQTLCGITTTASVVVTVNPLGVFEPRLNSSEFNISPNPNNGEVNIEITNKEFILDQSIIKIYDVFSRQVKDIPLLNKRQSLDLQDLSNGVYYLKFYQGKNGILIKKIIKQ